VGRRNAIIPPAKQYLPVGGHTMRHFNFKYLFLFLCLFLGQIGFCCINEYRALLNGTTVFTDADNVAPIGRFGFSDKSYILKKLHEADSIYKVTRKIEDYSDYGAMLIYNGQYLEGKQVFQEIESKLPGLYATAANLGTTYELLGMNDSAYFWINKALAINPKSHQGSEWIHLKILEAKIKSNNDPKYFQSHSILSLDFGETETPENKSKLDLEVLRDQLYHQLNERMTFIKPQDLIVGQLLFDLGNVNAITRDVKSGLQVFEVAKEYGFQSKLFDKREKHFMSLQRSSEFRNHTEGWARQNPSTAVLIIATLFIATLTGLFLIIKRFRKRTRLNE